MKFIGWQALIMALYVSATLVLAGIAAYLVHDGHPWFGCLSGLLAAASLVCAASVDIKIIKG